MEYIDKIIELAGNVNSIWTFLTFVIISLIISFSGIGIIIYKKKPEFYKNVYEIIFKKTKFRDEFLESQNRTNEIICKLNTKIDKLEIKVSEENKEIKANLNLIKSDVTDIKTETDKIKSNNKIPFRINEFTSLVNNFYSEFIEDKYLNDEFVSVLSRGKNKAIKFFSECMELRLERIQIDNFELLLKDTYRDLRKKMNLAKLGVGVDFNEYIKKAIILPEINEAKRKFEIHQESGKVNGKLYDEFSKIMLKFIEAITIKITEYYKSIQ